MDQDECIKQVERICGDKADAKKFVEKAIEGRELIKPVSEQAYDDWFNQRFCPNVVMIDRDDYSKAAMGALQTLSSLAATDFGGSRQRDFGQLWADQIRGYLAEIAVQKHLLKFGIHSKLAHQKGELEEFLDADIAKISNDGVKFVNPKKLLGIKGTKSNGIWLDVPGDQFNHSDYHILVKLGSDRGHLFGYFNELGMLDALMEEGKRVKVLDDDSVQDVIDSLPRFRPISAYIVGFVKKEGNERKLGDPGTMMFPGSTIFDGRKGKKHFKIHTWKGELHAGDYETVKQITEIEGNAQFEGIGAFSKSKHTIFNTGSLEYSQDAWRRLIREL